MKENKELKQLWQDYAIVREELWRFKRMTDRTPLDEYDHIKLLINQKDILEKIEAIQDKNEVIDSIATCNITKGMEVEQLVSCMSGLTEDDWDTGEDFDPEYISMMEMIEHDYDEYNSK